MMQDPIGTYEAARRRHAALHAEALRQRDLGRLRLPAWRLASASVLRSLADRVEGVCKERQQSTMAAGEH